MASQQYVKNQPVTRQPVIIDNVFSIVNEEKIQQTYECNEKVCGCGAKYTVTLTDARIIQRYQDYICGCRQRRVDSMLFLSDISSIKDTVEGQTLCGNGCSLSLCCLCILFPLGICCCLCRSCRNTGVPVTLKGAFGYETFTFSKHMVQNALAQIPATTLPHKVSNYFHHTGETF